MQPLQILLEQLRDIAKAGIELLPQAAIALFVIFLTWALAALIGRFVRKSLARSSMRPSLKRFIELVTTLAVWIGGFLLAAVVAFPNMTPTRTLVGLGIGTVAIGFAFKDVFENFLAGIIILLRREMRIGDFTECEGLEGKVETILVRETHIRQTDGQLVILPNSMLFKNPLTIRTDIEDRRQSIICGVAYHEDVDQSPDVIKKAVLACDSVLSQERPVQVFACEFADSSINFEVAWWTGSTPLEIRMSRDEVIASIKRALDEAGIEIPFPYRTLTFAGPVPIQQDSGDS